MWKISTLAIVAFLLAGSLWVVPDALVAESAITSSVQPASLPKKKQTSLGLYVTAKEAAGLLQNNKGVALIDVRTPEETMFVGYPQNAAANVPFKLVDPAYGFNAKKGSYKLVLNPKFLDSIRAFLKSDNAKSAHTLLLMCRSGGRSAAAVNALAEAGFTNVYSVVDGFEGDTGKNGKRTLNGWKNSGASWTTNVREDYWFRNQ